MNGGSLTAKVIYNLHLLIGGSHLQVGSTVYIANRGCEMETRHLKPMFDLGNVSHAAGNTQVSFLCYPQPPP